MAGEAERLSGKAIAMTKAFNGDGVLLQRVKDLVAKHGINCIVESGSYHGQTTAELAKIVDWVISIEINPAYLKIAKANNPEPNKIIFIESSSPDYFRDGEWNEQSRMLFFLDAHWNSYNPLIDELKAIAAAGIKPVILIHDFYVPGKSTTPGAAWGYDTYGGQDYTWEWIEKYVEAIYGNGGYLKSYNDDYTASRGCLILEPYDVDEEFQKQGRR